MFEKLWSRQSDSQTSDQEIVAEDKHATFISLKTKIASNLRAFARAILQHLDSSAFLRLQQRMAYINTI